jgi:hypothetical protein
MMGDINDLTQNVTLWNNAKGKNVSVITDGSEERLAVDIQGGTFQLQPFSPVTDVDTTGVVTNTSTWDTLVNVTSTQGKLDFIACVAGSSGYRVRVTADGDEVFDLAMSDLSTLGLSNATNVPIWAETADKNFRYHPNIEVDFTDSLKVEVKAVTGTPTVKHLITYRTLVP